jgi:methionyl-tRNA formyltransferase
MWEMKVKILGNPDTEAYRQAAETVAARGHVAVDTGVADLAIAPLLTRIVPPPELREPAHGTLIFHPSPLPWGRGASAIRWAYRRREPVTAATWFWADERVDAGDICEQEIIRIDYGLRPREFYEQHVLPAMCRTLERCLNDIERGIKRRVRQVEEYACYDARIE